MAGDRGSTREPPSNDPPRTGTFVLELALGPGEPPVGSLRRAGQEAALRFYGWIELMAAIKAILAMAVDTEPEQLVP